MLANCSSLYAHFRSLTGWRVLRPGAGARRDRRVPARRAGARLAAPLTVRVGIDGQAVVLRVDDELCLQRRLRCVVLRRRLRRSLALGGARAGGVRVAKELVVTRSCAYLTYLFSLMMFQMSNPSPPLASGSPKPVSSEKNSS